MANKLQLRLGFIKGMNTFFLARRHRILLVVLPLTLCAGMVNAKDSIEKAGDVLQIVIPAAGLGGTLFYEKGWDGSIQFAESLATSQAISEILKNVTHERRPNGGCCKSFPSGHTTAAFMGASFILNAMGWNTPFLPMWQQALSATAGWRQRSIMSTTCLRVQRLDQ